MNKKNMAAVFVCALLLLGGTAAAQTSAWKPAEFPSPDQAVLVYGVGGFGNGAGASQINFEKTPRFLLPQIKTKMVADYFCLEPVEPGSRWVRFDRYDDSKQSLSAALGKSVRCRFTARHQTLEAVSNPLAKDFSGKSEINEKNAKDLILDVPADKKIVFWNKWGVSADSAEDEKDAARYNKWYWESRKEALDFTISKYKGTAWEPLLAQEKEYVQKECQNAKGK